MEEINKNALRGYLNARVKSLTAAVKENESNFYSKTMFQFTLTELRNVAELCDIELEG